MGNIACKIIMHAAIRLLVLLNIPIFTAVSYNKMYAYAMVNRGRFNYTTLI